ncbi:MULTISPECIES: hypothetical protein [unclassified Neorhizobium]|uniref:hypothetical protein n=1 Tax=unclassified Neorhizobium TaxID=2629175 RepID=UPI001FF38C2B|nr:MULTISPECIES: hypothetical protein [unclassified Neorhizobium]MCJ9673238.1 hypothetical protein [Neorhizobium sp. SHOUNA12B]MCJ9746665.1 hypothetical protein [Neorhizobium sp. SHOUNA12A]
MPGALLDTHTFYWLVTAVETLSEDSSHRNRRQPSGGNALRIANYGLGVDDRFP